MSPANYTQGTAIRSQGAGERDSAEVSGFQEMAATKNALFMSNVQEMYASNGGGFSDMVWNGPLSRPQAELLAARVSSVNECFY